MGKALYRKYRSRSLDEIVGQEHVTSLLKNAVAKGKVAHAYLFTGPRGVGKTSIARILAHEINKLDYTDESTHLDIVEIDAASNNGVDDIRDLRDKVSLAPISATKKIYIIDEVHMLSKPAFNALLKTLEEPPEHVVFILATTDVDKLPDTIVSRTQKYSFRQASTPDIIKNLERVARGEKIAFDHDALELIAHHSGGSYRDSLSLFDQIISGLSESESLTATIVEKALGLAPDAQIRTLLEHLQNRNFTETVQSLKTLFSDGIQATSISDQLLQRIVTEPTVYQSLLPIVETLIDVRQSRFPDALLLACCGNFCSDSSQNSAAVASKPMVASVKSQIVQEIPSLVAKATEIHPKDDIATQSNVPDDVSEDDTKELLSDSTLDWSELFSRSDELSIGLKSVIKKCSFANNASSVAIYARTEFYKKKLETPKYQQELSDFLLKHTQKEWDIIVHPCVAPLKNKTVASVAAIMGGGEEIEI